MKKWNQEANDRVINLLRFESPEKIPDQETFKEEFLELLKGKTPQSRSIFAYVNRTISQFHLGGKYESFDVLIEVYIRGISCKNCIEKPMAWTRVTSFNVIQELYRKENRERDVAFETINQSLKETLNSLDEKISLEEIENNLNRVMISIKSLSKEEKELFQLRLIEKLSWEEIKIKLSSKGEKIDNLPTLRKKYSRALAKLRKRFHDK